MNGGAREGFSGMRPVRSKLQVIEAAIVCSLFVLSVGCNGFFVDPTLTSIVVSPVNPAVATNKTVQLTAFGTYDDGSRKTITSGVAWSSSSPSVSTIDQNTGIATGLTAGTTTITASDQGLSGTTTLTVVPSGITSITVTPTNASILVGSTQQYKAVAQDNTDVTQLVSWTSSDTTQVTITNASGGTGAGLASSIGSTATTVNITATLSTDTGTIVKTVPLIVTATQ
jgi:trimeric autotransporter adhesin